MVCGGGVVGCGGVCMCASVCVCVCLCVFFMNLNSWNLSLQRGNISVTEENGTVLNHHQTHTYAKIMFLLKLKSLIQKWLS